MKKNYNKIIKKIQKIRTKNNVNWMNILRVAMKYTQAYKNSKKY